MIGRAFSLGLAAWMAAALPAVAGDAPSGDAEIERILLEGRVVSTAAVPVGISKPLKVELELEGRTIRAVFKTLHQEIRGQSQVPGSTWQAHFTDSYRFEPAAYRLDRELGMGMVPVSVIRTIDGQEGTLVQWIDGVITEKAWKELDRPLSPALREQRRVMKVFDALVFNTDRNPGNSLLDLEHDRLWLIDHTRCFALNRDLPQAFASGIAYMPRDFARRLESLQADRLIDILGPSVSKARVKSLLARRDQILRKLEKDRRIHGDEEIFGMPPGEEEGPE